MINNVGNTNAKKHGLSKHPIYTIWLGMKNRCLNPNSASYKNWGGRGIKICKRWLDFMSFYEDVLPGYKPELSLDRRNNNGDYKPSNCRWATKTEQASNTRRNVKNTYSVDLLRDLKIAGLTAQHYRSRIRVGWSEHDARTIKLGNKRIKNKARGETK